jgi:uncharacterized protein YjbI with pentapeptide repeats
MFRALGKLFQGSDGHSESKGEVLLWPKWRERLSGHDKWVTGLKKFLQDENKKKNQTQDLYVIYQERIDQDGSYSGNQNWKNLLEQYTEYNKSHPENGERLILVNYDIIFNLKDLNDVEEPDYTYRIYYQFERELGLLVFLENEIEFALLDNCTFKSTHPDPSRGDLIKGANLGRAVLSAKLEEPTVIGLDFAYCELNKITVENIDIMRMSKCGLSDLLFRKCERISIADSTFPHSYWSEGSGRSELTFHKCYVFGIEGIQVEGAKFINCGWDSKYDQHTARSSFPKNKLIGSVWTETYLRDASFENTDLTGAKELMLDGNNIDGAKFGPNAPVAWLSIARQFTGASLFFNMFLTLVFFLPMIAKVFMYSVISHGEALGAVQGGLQVLCGRQVCRDSWVGLEVLGGRDALWTAGLSLFLIAYNAIRFRVTSIASRLVDEEKRSNHAPWLQNRTDGSPLQNLVFELFEGSKSYGWIIKYDRAFRLLVWVVIVLAGWHFWNWVSEPLRIPALITGQ